MKRFLTTTALVLTTATAGFAQSGEMLREQVETYFMNNGISQPIAELSDAQVAELYAAITSTDDASSVSQKVDAVLADEATGTTMARTQVIAEVEAFMMSNDITGPDLETLPNDTLAELYLIATSSDMMQQDLRFQQALQNSSPSMENGMSRGQIFETVETFFEGNGEYDVDVARLSEEQLNEVYFAITSSDSGNRDAKVRAAIN